MEYFTVPLVIAQVHAFNIKIVYLPPSLKAFLVCPNLNLIPLRSF